MASWGSQAPEVTRRPLVLAAQLEAAWRSSLLALWAWLLAGDSTDETASECRCPYVSAVTRIVERHAASHVYEVVTKESRGVRAGAAPNGFGMY